jgi:two-component system, cell cycle sensor histidine kinase and response regulator CckA
MVQWDARQPVRLLTQAVESAANAIVITDREGVIEWVNPAFSRLTGYSFAEALGRTPRDLVGSGLQDRAFFEDLWTTILSGEVWHGRLVNRRKDGSLYPEEQTITPVRAPDGRISHFVAIKVDVSEREQAEERLHLQGRLLDAVGQAVIATDHQGIITYWNRAAESLFGWSAPEALGRGTVELTVPEGEMERADEIMARMQRGESWTGEFELRRKDGSTFPALITDSPLLDEDGEIEGVIGVTTDLTELKELEGRFRHAQKMEAVGRLASGVAHDFNNVLTAIQGRAHLLAEELQADTPLALEVAELLSEVQRGARLTAQMLALARRQPASGEHPGRPSEHAPVNDLRKVTDEMRSMLRRLVPQRFDLEVELGEPEPPVPIRMSTTGIEQVLMNLTVNARDAVEEGGRIRVAVDRCRLDPDQIPRVRGPALPGPMGRLTVRDDGCGMDPEMLERIFEPFFTTKGEEQGTGLGLSTVFAIVEEAGGGIMVESRPGEGTTFHILLPLAEDPADKPEKERKPRGASPGGSGARAQASSPGSGPTSPPDAPDTPDVPRILVVDDDPAIRRLMSRILERKGYRVEVAPGGRDALQRICNGKGCIDVVVTDLRMPDMDGMELRKRIGLQDPSVRVIVSSGDGAEVLTPEARKAMDGFLAKPFTSGELLASVEATLRQEA